MMKASSSVPSVIALMLWLPTMYTCGGAMPRVAAQPSTMRWMRGNCVGPTFTADPRSCPVNTRLLSRTKRAMSRSTVWA